jgi:SPP1 gp7 family putative phage head morphogenesis protein
MSIELLELHKALTTYLHKGKRRERALLRHKRLLKETRPAMAAAAMKWLEMMRREIMATLLHSRGNNATELLNKVDWEMLKEKSANIFKPVYLKILNEGVRSIFALRKQEDEMDEISEEAITWARSQSARLVTEIDANTRKGLRQLIEEGLASEEGLSVQELARQIRSMIGLTDRMTMAVSNYQAELLARGMAAEDVERAVEKYERQLLAYRAEMIARTETAEALSEGTRRAYKVNGIKELEWVADPQCCAECSENNGKTYSVDEAEGMQPAHPNCLPEDSFILACGGISSVSKRWYEGEMIILETASHRKLSCTPNHPILTDRGFLPANLLNIGSNVISHGFSQREIFGDWNNYYRPTLIENITNSFLKSSGVVTNKMPTSSIDFHSDGIGSKVAIIGTNRFLKILNRSHRKIDSKKFPEDISFSWFHDKVIHFDTSFFRGYVHNLETEKSYYIANGIVNHNCECCFVMAVGEEMPEE